VIATQNPVEYEGTYPLPEAQLDRFMVRVALGYPSPADEADMIAEQADRPLVDELRPVAGISDVVAAQEAATTVHASQALRDYVVALVNATRADPRTDLGASPRAGLMLLKAAKAHAALAERDHVLPDDVQVLAEPVLAHRLMLAPEAGPASGAELIRDAMEGLPAL
jgi:MoxR-like ATPase